MLDGEYLTVTGTSRREACFYPFDLPDHHRLSLSERWPLLMEMLAPMQGSGLVEPCPSNVSWEDVVEHGWEGVVFKRLGSRYKRAIVPGKTVASWVKYRAEWL
jgi:ATP-dependent DNA ligase